MEVVSETASHSNQQARRITSDWFRSPTTDYLNVSSVVYPRGARATVQELEENNAFVNILYFKYETRQFHARGRHKEGSVISLFVDTDDQQDASDASTTFAAVQIENKALIDAIRPALASIHYPVPETTGDQLRLYAPFNQLFFAQGRLLETLKHGGLGNVKDKLLRAFIMVLKVILRKTNHHIRELAGQRTIDFDHIWTLFPLGSFVAHEVKQTTHLFQTLVAPAEPIAADPIGKRKEDKNYPFEFASYGFDGYNWGMFQDKWMCWKFEGQVSVSSLEYRPLKFDERYVDPLLAKKAVEKGRKTLDFQSYHHCHYVGKGFAINTRDGLEQINGRIVVDCLQARTCDPEWWTFYYHNEPKICPVPAKRQEIFNAMRPLYIKTNTRRPTLAEQEKRKQVYSAHEEYLMLMKPLVPGWSLDYNDWFWLDVSGLESVTYLENPLSHLVIDNEKSINLLNKLISRKLQLIPSDPSQQQPKQATQRKNLLIQFCGPTGTGKTATARAIAEHHKRPVVRISVADLPTKTKEAIEQFALILEFARDWNAILLIDTATSFFEIKRPTLSQDLAKIAENFSGIGIFVKRDNETLVEEVSKQFQIHFQLEPFTAEKREKIWRLLFDAERKLDPVEVFRADEDTIKRISEWELNGHEIRHLFDNIVLLQQANEAETVTFEDIEDLKDITCYQPKTSTGKMGGPESIEGSIIKLSRSTPT